MYHIDEVVPAGSTTVPTDDRNHDHVDLVVGENLNTRINNTIDEGECQSSFCLNEFYYTTTDMGELNNFNVTEGNPLRGLACTPFDKDKTRLIGLNYSVEFSYYPFNAIVKDRGVYDWTAFEDMLTECSTNRTSQLVPRIFIHYVGHATLSLPPYLLDDDSEYKIETRHYDDFDGGISPYYGDCNLLQCIHDFIVEFGRRYDGDNRIAFIQAGLLGFWGEWHTLNNPFLPDETRAAVIEWYSTAFTTTKIMTRYPTKSAGVGRMGYHDDSFTYSTFDCMEGGHHDWFFWSQAVSAGVQDFWKYAPMGGELRPESVANKTLDPEFPGTEYCQNFLQCVTTTHATYMNFPLFDDDGDETNHARYIHVRMGYSFQIIRISVQESMSHERSVDVVVTVQQIGVAPFYYPLSLVLHHFVEDNDRDDDDEKTVDERIPNDDHIKSDDDTCPAVPTISTRILKGKREKKMIENGVETIIEQNDTKNFTFIGVPATVTSLSGISFTLESPMLLPTRPIKFAQGIDGTVTIDVPLPPQ